MLSVRVVLVCLAPIGERILVGVAVCQVPVVDHVLHVLQHLAPPGQ